MRLKYKLRSFAMADGERYCLLADPTSGAPLFYPNLFVTTQIRNTELSTASMEAALVAINVLLVFCDTRSIEVVNKPDLNAPWK